MWKEEAMTYFKVIFDHLISIHSAYTHLMTFVYRLQKTLFLTKRHLGIKYFTVKNNKNSARGSLEHALYTRNQKYNNCWLNWNKLTTQGFWSYDADNSPLRIMVTLYFACEIP